MIKSNVKDGSFVKHTIGGVLEPGWMVRILEPNDFPEVTNLAPEKYLAIVLGNGCRKQLLDGKPAKLWTALLPNGKKVLVYPEEVELIAG